MHSISKLIDSFAATTAQRDRDQIDLSVARLLHDYVEATRVAVYRLIDDASTPRVQRRILIDRFGHEYGPQTQPLSELPRLLDNPQWYECNMTLDAVHYQSDTGGGATMGTVFPLPGEKGAVGLIEIELAPHRTSLQPREVKMVHGLLRLLSNHLAVLDYGQRDTLTGLLNRRTFEQSFDKIAERSRTLMRDPRSTAPSWFAIADIDRFKSINDRYGHLFGDDVLLLVARLMRQSFRTCDQLYRFGGEEFVIVLEGTSPEGAEGTLERFRKRVAEHVFPQVGQVTISIGYTRIGASDPAVTCFDRADAALYYAKENGRDQARSYEALIAEGLLDKREDATADIELF
ncbi:MAG TPA: GGDEF domain-containing protein [Burkholderiaceae bacterium]|jgi:diguanylate cyclase (GGDEF)-like protein|nr:GGDEF domain-containing protein [Burkholderiaceae bacterium]